MRNAIESNIGKLVRALKEQGCLPEGQGSVSSFLLRVENKGKQWEVLFSNSGEYTVGSGCDREEINPILRRFDVNSTGIKK